MLPAILDKLKVSMKEMSRPPVSRPDLPFAVKIEKPHTVSHTQTVATTPSCYDPNSMTGDSSSEFSGKNPDHVSKS